MKNIENLTPEQIAAPKTGGRFHLLTNPEFKQKLKDIIEKQKQAQTVKETK